MFYLAIDKSKKEPPFLFQNFISK